MSDSIKEVIATDLQKAKSEGSTRVARIRNILQEAAVQALAEVKEGSGEIRTIAKDSFSTVVEAISEEPNSAPPENASEAAQPATDTEPQASPRNGTKTLLIKLYAAIRKQVLAQFTDRVARVDQQLTDHYGDRYAALKQRWGHFVTAYQSAKATAVEQESDPVQAKQAEVADRAGEIGVAVAQKEQQIRQQLKDFLQTTAAKI